MSAYLWQQLGRDDDLVASVNWEFYSFYIGYDNPKPMVHNPRIKPTNTRPFISIVCLTLLTIIGKSPSLLPSMIASHESLVDYQR